MKPPKEEGEELLHDEMSARHEIIIEARGLPRLGVEDLDTELQCGPHRLRVYR